MLGWLFISRRLHAAEAELFVVMSVFVSNGAAAKGYQRGVYVAWRLVFGAQPGGQVGDEANE